MSPNKDRGLKETEHLLRSPANAKRVLQSLREAEQGRGTPDTVENLRRSRGLDRAERPKHTRIPRG